METSWKIVIAILVAAMLLFPFSAYAEMGSHSKSGHMHHGDHANMTERHDTMGNVYEHYFAIQTSLAGDSMEGVSVKAKAMAEVLKEASGEFMKSSGHDHGAKMSTQIRELADAAMSLAGENDISSARETFGVLSEKMVEYQRHSDNAQSMKAYIVKCDMAKKVWLQESKEIRNPYYGSSMLRCGRIID